MDVEFTRFYMCSVPDDEWMLQEYDHEMVSLTLIRKGKQWAWHLLSKRGVVIELSTKGASETSVGGPDVGPDEYGYVRRIRNVNGELYVCGMCRQVYKKSGKNWHSISNAILAPVDSTEYNFRDIGGEGSDNLYAVGWQGEIFHYDGKNWNQCGSPTNEDLNSLKFSDDGTVYICGKNGALLYGSGDNWTVVDIEDFDEDLWGIEEFRGSIYVSSRRQIFRLDGSSLLPIQTGLKPSPDSGILHSNEQELWSFGNYDVMRFDGDNWKRVICPDNE